MAAMGGIENDPEWQQIQEEITCSICSDLFYDPKTIPCLHTFCKECLEKSIDANKKMGIAPCCPLCRATLPENDLDLPTNFRIKRFIEIFRKRAALEATLEADSPSTEAVHGCGKCEKDLLAVTWCMDCQVSLCCSCDEIHTKWKDFKSHKTATIEEYLQNPSKFTHKFMISSKVKPKQPQMYIQSTLASEILKDSVESVDNANKLRTTIHTTDTSALPENFGKMKLNEKGQPHMSSMIDVSKRAKPVINLQIKTTPSYPLFVAKYDYSAEADNAKYDYSAEADNVLSFKKGDVFYVINNEENWWSVISKDLKNEGYVPSNFFTEIGPLSAQE